MKGDARVFLDIEASEDGPGNGDSTDSNNDGKWLRQNIFILLLISYEQEMMDSLMTTMTRGVMRTWRLQKKTILLVWQWLTPFPSQTMVLV